MLGIFDALFQGIAIYGYSIKFIYYWFNPQEELAYGELVKD